jgi:hypothetical protein
MTERHPQPATGPEPIAISPALGPIPPIAVRLSADTARPPWHAAGWLLGWAAAHRRRERH